MVNLAKLIFFCKEQRSGAKFVKEIYVLQDKIDIFMFPYLMCLPMLLLRFSVLVVLTGLSLIIII